MNRFVEMILTKTILDLDREKVQLKLRLLTAILLGTWLLLVLLGKGGFVHLLLLSSIGIAFVDAVGVYRSRMTA